MVMNEGQRPLSEAAAALPDAKEDETWSDDEWGVIGEYT